MCVIGVEGLPIKCKNSAEKVALIILEYAMEKAEASFYLIIYIDTSLVPAW